MFLLKLNDMRSSNIETTSDVAIADTKEEIEVYVREQKAPESYKDGQWGKVFLKGSLLEWYNEPFGGMGQGIIDIGDQDKWAQKAREDFNNFIVSIPRV